MEDDVFKFLVHLLVSYQNVLKLIMPSWEWHYCIISKGIEANCNNIQAILEYM